jgi:RimJ/RimL family protein N-acetyltransferase
MTQPDGVGPAPLDDDIARLRAVEPTDLERTRRWRNDPSVWARTLGTRLPVTEAMERAWFESLATRNDRVVFAIDDVSSGMHVGITMLHEIDHWSRSAKFGIFLGDADRRGRGVGTAATRLVLGYAWGALGLGRVWLEVTASNLVARRTYERLGFVEEGLLRAHVFVGGGFEDVVVMGLLLDPGRRA